MQLYKLQTSSVNHLLLSLDKKIKKNKPTQEQSNKYQMDKISVSRSRSASKCRASSYPALHDPEDALEDLDVAGDPEHALVAEPELLPEQLRERPVVQVLRGDHEPPHLVADVHGEGTPRHAALSRRRRRHHGQLLPLLEQLLKPHDVHDLVAHLATVLLHCWCSCLAGELAVERLQRLERSIEAYLEPTASARRREGGQALGMLTPKEGKVVEPASWGKDSVAVAAADPAAEGSGAADRRGGDGLDVIPVIYEKSPIANLF
jgi:hypothetical protein